MDAISCIKNRRSIRKFKDQPIEQSKIESILENARWAPSGMNLQPWRVIVITNQEIKNKIAQCSKYSNIINSAPVILAIFLNKEKEYNYVKNVQSIGAFFQSLLLTIHAHGLGSVWIGEIYNQKEDVQNLLKINEDKNEFMGLIAFGYPAEKGISTRKNTEEIVLKWYL
ncbi:nitroreductase family protein [Candidatus Harpocratesius sp.]